MNSIELTALVLAALLSENFIMVHCMGIGTRSQAFRDPREGWRTGLALTLVMVVSAPLSRGVDMVLVQMGMDYLRLLAFALLVPGVSVVLRRLLHMVSPDLFHRLEGPLRAVSSNAAALGAVLLASQRSYDLGQTFAFALFGGAGATLVMMSFAGLGEEVSFDSCPKAFRGTPILFITGGLMALAFMGYYGLNLR